MWQRFSVLEAQRLREYLDFQEDGVAGVVRAMNFETMAPGFPPFEVEEIDVNRVVLSYPRCLPQEARVRQGLGEFACKEVGIASWGNFACALDPRVKLRCLFAPPDAHPPEAWCRWEVYQ